MLGRNNVRESFVRFRLLRFQASLGQEKESIDKLLSLLQDESSDVRSSAASALGELGNTSDPILPKVVLLLEQNRDENLMGNAINCLWSIVLLKLVNRSDELTAVQR